MAVELFAPLFEKVRDGSTNITSDMANVISTITPAFQAVFVVYCMFVIYSYWENESSIHGTAMDLVKRIITWGILLGFGMNVGTYMSVVMPFVNELGDGLSTAYGSDGSASGLDTMIQKILEIMDKNFAGSEEVSDEMVADASGAPPVTDESGGGIWDAVTGAVSSLTSGAMEAMFGGLYEWLTAMMKNVILFLCGAIYIAVAGAYLLVAQVLLTILAAVGPIFFGFGLFPATRQFFNNWISSVLNYGFLFLFTTVLVNLSVSLIDAQLDIYYEGLKSVYGLGNSDVGIGDSLASVFTLACMFIVFTVVLFQLPQLTSSLFSGLAAGGYSKMLSQAKNAAVLGRSMFNRGGGNTGGSSKPENQISKGK